MKSSQVMARIEAAGWKRIRSVGSHFTYEREGKRVLYAYGRPQTEIGKRNLRDIEARFHLKEIEQQKEVTRLSKPASVIQVRVHSEEEMTDQTARLFFAQLHRDHGATIPQIGKALDIAPADLVGYLHHGENLKSSDRAALWAWLGEQGKKHDLIRDRNELLRRGYGARVGSSNSRDPFLKTAQTALKIALQGDNRQSDLARTIGVHESVVRNILRGTSKTVYPENRTKIQRWITDNELVETPGVQPETMNGLIKMAHEQIASPVSQDGEDPELEAIRRVMKAIKGLNPSAAQRALRYALERV